MPSSSTPQLNPYREVIAAEHQGRQQLEIAEACRQRAGQAAAQGGMAGLACQKTADFSLRPLAYKCSSPRARQAAAQGGMAGPVCQKTSADFSLRPLAYNCSQPRARQAAAQGEQVH